MPSKKKSSKTPSRLSTPDPSESSRMSSSSNSVPDAEASEEELRCSLGEASCQFPSLIGRSASIGRVAHVDSDSRGFKIWLSEASMVAASLAPGSTVSVSLASSGRRFSDCFPLSSIRGEYEVDYGSGIINEPGDYFVLATVFPSSKVLKNAVRFSFNLHCGLGCPASGRVVFVYPVQSHSMTATVNGRDGQPNSEVSHLSMHVCKELHLELTPYWTTLEVNKDSLSSKKKLSAENSQDKFENGNSPQVTPLHLTKLRNSNPLASPTCEGSASSISKQKSPSVNLDDIVQVLRNESAKRLLQNCATSWLCSCCLLYGNHVAVPVLSDMCVFRVKGAYKLSVDSSNQDVTYQNGQNISLQTPEPVEHAQYAFIINQETKIYLRQPLNSASEIPEQKVLPRLQLDNEEVETNMGCDSSQLGGLSREFAVLKDIIISSSMKNALSSLGLRTTKGVLLHGPPGTGKTSLARLCARDSGVNFFTVNGPEIVSQYFGESEQALHEVFSSASKAMPAVIFIDELDAIAPSRRDGSEELSQRMVATLLNLMDGISRTNGVLVIAATNRPDSIEPALRRPGRLDREIEIGVPSPRQRFDILQTLLGKMENSLSDMQVQHLATTTHGFVGADLAALCNEAALVCLRRHTAQKCYSSDVTRSAASTAEGSDFSRNLRGILSDCSDSASSCITESPIPSLSLANGGSSSSEQMPLEEHTLKVAFEDFEKAKMKVRPSAMREVILEVPKVNWEDVGGQNEVKNQLKEAVEWPQKHQDAFKRIGTRPPTGILLFGPPGCSKTLMARAVASEAGLNFLAVKGPELFSKWVGESEKAVRSLFAKARVNAPSIIFFDEIDGLAVIRGKESDGISVSDRVMSQLLVELDGLHQRVDVTVIAATNRPDKIDPALLRPGRFDRLLYVGPPNETDREEIFRIHLRKIPCSSNVSLKELASLTEGCTGADISLICREAALAALEESLEAKEITMQHLKTAISHVQPTEVQSYKELSAKFQRLVHSIARGEGRT